ncbi:MAG: hypothetical protein KI790_01710 [Cyclobacteriaceae bacterium]|nr:hypothetical protein [Cyclobacteriaceae bacterium HetDA_MAG_MS6]
MIYQDWRSRSIDAIALITCIGLSVIYFWSNNEDYWQRLLSAGYVLALIVIAWAYAFVRKKSMSELIGAGDLIFLLAPMMMLEFVEFVVWLNASLIGTLIVVSVIKYTRYSKLFASIPLITFLGVTLIPIIVLYK